MAEEKMSAEEACNVATSLKVEIGRLKAEKKQAEAEAKEAIEARDKAKAALETTNLRLGEARLLVVGLLRRLKSERS